MPIDFQTLIQERLSGLPRQSLPMNASTFSGGSKFANLLKMLQPPEQEEPAPSSQLAAAQTRELSGADPEEDSGFNVFNSIFGALDFFGRPIRGLIGAGTAALQGEGQEALNRIKDAALSPIDALTFNIFDIAPEKDNTTGSEILDDLGWKSGTTTEDERRIRVAMAAGLSHRDAKRQFGMQGDKALLGEDARRFDNIINEAKKRNPNLDTDPTIDDFKNAVDAQDFAGFAVDVLADPLTYMSAGMTGIGKAAKAVALLEKQAPKVAKLIRAAETLASAKTVIKDAAELTGKQKKRLDGLVTRAWSQAKEGERPSLYLADNWAKQTREGQRAMLTTLNGRPLIKGGPVAEVLSMIGQTKTAESILGRPDITGNTEKFLDLPGVGKLVGGANGLVRFMRDKLDTNTGVAVLDKMLLDRSADSRTSLTEIGQTLNALDAEIKSAAGKVPAREQGLRQTATLAVELMKQTGQSPQAAAEAANLALGMSTTLLENQAVAKVAAGIVRINNEVLQRAKAVPTRIRQLNDDSIEYLHRMLTPEGRKYFKELKNRRNFSESSGLEFNARSRTFKARNSDSLGKTTSELNQVFRDKNGFDLFVEDPIMATREAVRLTQRAVANAKFGVAFVNQYGSGVDDILHAATDAIDTIPEKFLNPRKAALLDYESSKAAAKILREEGKQGLDKPTALGKDISAKLSKSRAPGAPDLRKIPEGIDSVGVASHLKAQIKEVTGKEFPPKGEVSAFDIYNRLGLKLPEDPDGVARLLSVTVPEEAAKFVTRALKVQEDPSAFWKHYARAVQWLKASVTVPFAAFHGRNALENTFKSFIEGNVNPANFKNAAKLLSQASDLNAGAPDWVGNIAKKIKSGFKAMGTPDKAVMDDLEKLGLGNTLPKIADWLVAHDVLDNRMTSEFGDVLQDGIAGTTTAARKVRGLGAKAVKELGTQGGAIRGGFALASGTENLYRVSLFLDRVRKGLSAEEAAAEVKRVFFDYRHLTNAESKYSTYGGFFYRFYRENLRYILGRGATHPQELKQITSAFQNDPDNPKQRWLSDKAAFRVGANEIALGFLPQQQFAMFNLDEGDITDKLSAKGQDALGQLNPMLTTPLELAFNKDLFTGGPLLQETSSADWSFAPEPVQDIIGYHQDENGQHKIGKVWKLIFGALPVLGRFSSTGINLTSKEKNYWQKLAQVTTGVRIEDRDLEKEDLALIDRNLMRAKSELPMVKRTGAGGYRITSSTEEGRLASVLIFPSKEKMPDLGLDPEIFFTLKPYMTFDKEGKVILTGILRQKMHELAVAKFPKEQAFFDGVEARAAVLDDIRSRQTAKVEQEAQDRFEALTLDLR